VKKRNGFVSNSSTSSFCVYGWDMEYGDGKTQKEKLKELLNEDGSVLDSFNCYHCYWIGVGNQYDVETDEDGEALEEAEEPSQELMEKLDELVKVHNLPEPSFTSGTFYNG